jgi:hypothetical protein
MVPSGAVVCGEPAAVTHRTEAVLEVGGAGVTHYVFSLNDPGGPWSEERPVGTPIRLAGLQSGHSYTVYVLGKDSAGRWQGTPNASRTWLVDTAHRRLVINEVLAINATRYEHEGTFPDLIELYYDGPGAMSLTGMSLTDDPKRPDRFVFPQGVTMSPGDYLVLIGDDDVTGSGLRLGFGLDGDGEAVYLYDREGKLVDSVEFGHQLTDTSIGRIGWDGRWQLTVPTPGWANEPQIVGDARQVGINEWLAQGQVLFDADFIELRNPHVCPVNIGGFVLTDNPVGEPEKSGITPLSFIAGDGFVVFEADG